MSTTSPFWPRTSPHFAQLRAQLKGWEKTPIAIGLSGGADSLALVAAAVAEGFDVLALCVDHGLSEGSAAVADAAANQARTWGARAQVLPITVPPGNIEAEARRARYAALFQAAGTRPVWVAHTLDDQAETFILSTLRGRGVGMSMRGRVHRPFLGIRRSTTVAACQELGVTPWEDPMNSDLRFRRVRIRREVLPLLGDIVGGDAAVALAAAAHLAAEDDAAIEVPTTTDVEALAALPKAARRRAYLHLAGVGLSSTHIEAIDALVMRWKGQGPVAIAGGEIARVGGRIELRRKSRLELGQNRGKL